MRAAVICVFFALIIHKEGSHAEQDDDFKPTPIPLGNWLGERHVAGTLQEFIKTDAPPTVAALPAHYWEDALRHSVYLTLVRDKIDQLIAKGAIISPDSKPTNDLSKEVDDHDLWEKIKKAPFDRVKEIPLPPGDIIILAKGKLLEVNGGYRFAEDNATLEGCNKENCTQAVKAYWSVKRMRQSETSPGKYHYELTFSVTQAGKKLQKRHDNPVRTFTIKENTPTERPRKTTRFFDRQYYPDNTKHSVWLHKNIGQVQNIKRQNSLERFFSSLFSDDDDRDYAVYRRKPPAPTPQHVKLGHINDRDPYQQKLKPSRRPLLPPVPIPYVPHPYGDIDQTDLSPLTPIHPDNMYVPGPHITKQPVLPTPTTNYHLSKESTIEVPVRTTVNSTDATTKFPEITTKPYRTYTSHKQPPMKLSSFPENIRPPVYNAPPGVFVTMDKKPFKPLPPMKLTYSHKAHKTTPFDFRPSPQILESTQTDTDTSADTAFRPITLNLTELFNSKKGPKNHQKPTTSKKPYKKHENIHSYRLTTVSPDIITLQDIDYTDELKWAEILSAFTKTTPMISHAGYTDWIANATVNANDNEATEPVSTTVTAQPVSTQNTEEEEVTEVETPTTSTTTTSTISSSLKSKRTRPPPKFTKPQKAKKHKRVTSTTTTTTTVKPTRAYTATRKPSDDLTPQASSAATSDANSLSGSKKKETTTSSTSTTTSTKFTTATSTIPSTNVTQTTSATTSTNGTVSTTSNTSAAPVTNTTQNTTDVPSTSTTYKTLPSTSTNPSTSARPTSSRTTTLKRTTPTKTSTSRTTSTTVTEPTVTQTQAKRNNRFRQSTLMTKGTSVNHDKWSMFIPEKNRTVAAAKYQRRTISKFRGYVSSSTPRIVDEEKDPSYLEDHEDRGFTSNSDNGTAEGDEDDVDDDDDDTTTQTTTLPTTQLISITTTETSENKDGRWNHEDVGINGEAYVTEGKDDDEFIFPNISISPSSEDYSNESQFTVQEIEPTQAMVKNKTKCKKKKNHTNTEQFYKRNEPETTTITVPITTYRTTTDQPVTPGILEELISSFTMDYSEKDFHREGMKHEQYLPMQDDIEDFLVTLDHKDNKAVDHDDEEDYDEQNETSTKNEDKIKSHNYPEDYSDMNVRPHQKHKPPHFLELMVMQ